MENCIFCKIVAGEIPSVKLWEDENYLAILDAFPACKGQTLVMPKRHVHSDIFVLPDEDYSVLLVAAKKLVTLLKQGFSLERVGMVVEGLQVDHAHVKLYPFWGGKSFEGGFAGTEMLGIEELQKVAEELM